MHIATSSKNAALNINGYFNVEFMLQEHLFHLFGGGKRVNNNNQMDFSLSVKQLSLLLSDVACTNAGRV